jgi:hypothetical protein
MKSEYPRLTAIGPLVVSRFKATLAGAGKMPQPVAQLQKAENDVLAEYVLRDIRKPTNISGYELTRALPDNLKSSLPSIEEIEAELSEEVDE